MTDPPKGTAMATLPDKVEPAAAPPSGRRRRLWVLAGTVLVLIVGWFTARQLWAWHHWRGAQQALRQLDFPEALAHLEWCLRIWPGSASVRLEAARAARRGNDYDRFEQLLSECEKQGTTTQTALERELLLAQRGNLQADVERALHQLVEDEYGDSVLILEALAQGYRASLRLGSALVALEKLIERAPDHKWAYFWRGNIQADTEHMADAVGDFRRAAEIDPKSIQFRFRLATALVSLGRAQDAWPHVAELLRHEPTNADALLAAARCQRVFGDRPQALEYLKQLLDEDPNHAEGWAERGLVFSDEGNGTEAVHCLRRAFKLEPRSYIIGFALFNELTAQGLHSEAKVVWMKIEESKRRSERFKELLMQLAKDHRNVALRHELGTLFLNNQGKETALHFFNSVLQIDPGYKPTHKVLAEYYQRQGNSDRAAYHRRQAGLPEP
jgi:tetratricopeptide (TPR) repeat protein